MAPIINIDLAHQMDQIWYPWKRILLVNAQIQGYVQRQQYTAASLLKFESFLFVLMACLLYRMP